MVESTGLENRHTLIAYLGFKSLSLRHIRRARRNASPFRVLVQIFGKPRALRHIRRACRNAGPFCIWNRGFKSTTPRALRHIRKAAEKSAAFRVLPFGRRSVPGRAFGSRQSKRKANRLTLNSCFTKLHSEGFFTLFSQVGAYHSISIVEEIL